MFATTVHPNAFHVLEVSSDVEDSVPNLQPGFKLFLVNQRYHSCLEKDLHSGTLKEDTTAVSCFEAKSRRNIDENTEPPTNSRS